MLDRQTINLQINLRHAEFISASQKLTQGISIMRFRNKFGTTRLSSLGFTLAEVLITLGIIGIVAAMTIPTLVNNYQKTQYATQLKKAYTLFNQVLMQVTNDYGCNGDLACTGLFDASMSNQKLGDVLVKYFKIVKNCGTVSNGGCFPANTNSNFDGSSTVNSYDAQPYYKFVTADGISFIIRGFGFDGDQLPNCTNNWTNGITNNMTKTCGLIRVDINGIKGPNTLGRDSFHFWITNGKGALLYPRGGADDGYMGNHWWKGPNPNLCSSGNLDGFSCPGRIMEEGWQMNY